MRLPRLEGQPILRTLTQLSRKEEREDDQRPLDFRLIARLFHYTRPYASTRNWLLVWVIVRSIQLPALTWVIAAVINGPIQRRDPVGVVWGAVAFTVLAISTQWVMHYRQRFALELGESVVRDLRIALFQHLQRMPMSFFHRTKLGRIISRMTSDIEDVRVGVQEVLFVSLVQVGQMAVAAVFMLWYDAFLFLIVLGLAPALWAINHYFHRKLSQSLRAMRDSFSRVTATLAESVLGVRVTQGFVRQDENARMFRELAADHSNYNYAVLRTYGLFLPLLDLNNQFFIAILLLVGGARALAPAHATQLGDLVGFLFMANMFFSPISNLGTQYNQALTAMAGAERLFMLLDSPPEWADRPDAVDLPRMRGRVEFQNVRFAYDPERPVLRDIDFIAEPGQTVALVGHTGSGKTTIINLIAKFYLPTAGRSADRRVRDPRHHGRFAAPPARHRGAAEFSVHGDRCGKHPRRPAGRHRRGDPRRPAPARLRRSARKPPRRPADPGRRAGRRHLVGPKAARLLRAGPAGRSADSDPRRSHQQRRQHDRSPHPTGLGSPARRPHGLRRRPPPEHDPPCRPGLGARPRPHRRARHPRRASGRRRRLRPALSAVHAVDGGVIRRVPRALEATV